MHTELLEVTPAMATAWLGKNTANRSVIQKVVERYTRDMKNGNWHLTHQGISFYEDGTLLDGQHRLHAIIKAGVPVTMLVSTGLPRDAILAVDQNKMRTPRDTFKIMGEYPWVGDLHVAILNTYAFFVARTLRSKKLTIDELRQQIQSMGDELILAAQILTPKRSRITLAPVACALLLALQVESLDRLYEFGAVLLSGIPQGGGDVAALLLRDRLLRGDCISQIERKNTLFLTQRAIKAFCAQENISKLLTPTGNLYPPLKAWVER